MEGSFFTIVVKIITKLFLALVSVYAPAEKNKPITEPITTEVTVEYVIPDQSIDAVETWVIKINDIAEIGDISVLSGCILLKGENNVSLTELNNKPEGYKYYNKKPEGKATLPIRLKKV